MSVQIIHAIPNAEIAKHYYKKVKEETKKKVHYLIAYPFLRGNATKLCLDYRDYRKDLFLDSGAFSVYQGKAKINVYEYAMYLKQYQKVFIHAFSLDDKFHDPDHNLENHIFIEEALPRGQSQYMIPVVHDVTDPLTEFKTYVEMNYDYIALSSDIAKRNKQACVNIRRNFPETKIHLFGYLEKDLLVDCRPNTADSSGAQHMARFGSIRYWRFHEEEKPVAYNIYWGKKDHDKENHTNNLQENINEAERQASEKQPASKEKTPKNIHISDCPFKKEITNFLKETFGFSVNSVLDDEMNARVVNMFFYQQLEDIVNQEIQAKKETVVPL